MACVLAKHLHYCHALYLLKCAAVARGITHPDDADSRAAAVHFAVASAAGQVQAATAQVTALQAQQDAADARAMQAAEERYIQVLQSPFKLYALTE